MTRSTEKRMRVTDALAAARTSGDGLYGVLLERGTLELGFYRPAAEDLQQPHTRDEVYIVQSGHGQFECGGRTQPFEPGEALFVPAGVEHRFVDFSDDFTAWVMFYGPEGGECPEAESNTDHAT
jgi:mannose-6-phosphate isomerase-like protein (cupin superfamily)